MYLKKLTCKESIGPRALKRKRSLNSVLLINPSSISSFLATLKFRRTLKHISISIIRNGEDMRRNFMTFLALERFDNFLSIDRQLLVWVDNDAEKPRVSLKNMTVSLHLLNIFSEAPYPICALSAFIQLRWIELIVLWCKWKAPMLCFLQVVQLDKHCCICSKVIRKPIHLDSTCRSAVSFKLE